MKFSDKWWTSPAEGEKGQLVIVTGRDGIDAAMESGKYTARVDVSWEYDSTADGMPTDEDARILENVTEALKETFRKENAAVLTGIYTGEGRRDWVFYTRNLGVFGKLFNQALADLPQLPLLIEAESDPDWEEYREMKSRSYIPEAD